MLSNTVGYRTQAPGLVLSNGLPMSATYAPRRHAPAPLPCAGQPGGEWLLPGARVSQHPHIAIHRSNVTNNVSKVLPRRLLTVRIRGD